jgi:hypothetical protein
MKKHMLICFFLSMLVAKEEEWSTYEERRENFIKNMSEIIKFSSEFFRFQLVEIGNGQQYKGLCKIFLIPTPIFYYYWNEYIYIYIDWKFSKKVFYFQSHF